MARQVRIIAPLLVAQAVAEALRSRGVPVVGPTAHDRLGRAAPPDVVLLLVDEPTTPAGVSWALHIVRSHPGRVLALTEPVDSRFGQALVVAGAAGLLPSTISLDEVVEAVERLADGAELVDAEERRRLQRDWSAFTQEVREERSRLDTLSPRERTILREMDSGSSVSVIAARLGVAETTVRSQVKSVLRKLGVGSQLAAVAVARRLESPLVAGAVDLRLGCAEGQGEPPD